MSAFYDVVHPRIPRRELFSLGPGMMAAAMLGLAGGVCTGLAPVLTTRNVPTGDRRGTYNDDFHTCAYHRDDCWYAAFRRAFVLPDGRVIDTGNGGMTHSEGQGVGMLFAAMFDDRLTFDTIYHWTQQHLGRQGDALFTWRYDPAPGPSPDLNDAADGDIFIAAALWRASGRWRSPDYADASRAIATDILRNLVEQVDDLTVLLPGSFGFRDHSHVVVNLSYYCYAALHDLAQAVPCPVWGALERSAVTLTRRARFGRWNLPPDWLRIGRGDHALAPAPGWPARFSFDAVRVPFYLAWGGPDVASLRQALRQFRADTSPRVPAWVDLHTDALAPYDCSPGMCAVEDFALRPVLLHDDADAPPPQAYADYYSASLTLLSHIAALEAVS